MEFFLAAGFTLFLIEIVENIIRDAYMFKWFFYFCIVIVGIYIFMLSTKQ